MENPQQVEAVRGFPRKETKASRRLTAGSLENSSLLRAPRSGVNVALVQGGSISARDFCGEPRASRRKHNGFPEILGSSHNDLLVSASSRTGARPRALSD